MPDLLDDKTLRDVIEAAPDGFLIVDDHGCILFANGQSEKLLGYERDQLLGEPVEMLIPSRYAEGHLGHRDGFQNEPTTRPMGIGLDLVARRRDGSELPVEISLSPIRARNGLLIACVIRDVSERRRAQLELKRSFALLKAVAEGTTDAIFVKDMRGRYLMINSAGARFIGLSPEQIIGRDDAQLLSRDTGRNVMASDHEVIASGETRTVEEVATAAGVTRTYHTTKAPFRDADGRIAGLVGVARDITERKQANELLRESEERFRLLVDGLQDYAIFMLDQWGCVESWNAAAERITGYTADEVLGRHCSIFYRNEDVDERVPDQDMQRARAEGRHELEGWRVRKDGSEYVASVVTTALLTEHGELRGYSKVVRDVTDRRRLEEERERLLTETEAQRERERIAMDLHDGVIQSIYAATLVLEDAAHRVVEEPMEARARVDRATDTLTSVIEEIRHYIMDLRPRFSHPADLTHALTALARQSEIDSKALVSFETDGSLANVNENQAVCIFRVAQEALNNIAKHAGAANVDVLLTASDGHVRLLVEDDGAGFDASAGRPGSHQGLRNMMERARALRGKLLVESEPGRGTRLELRLPVDL